MWSSFRALARRIGRSVEQIDAVERGCVTQVQHPLAEDTHFMVRSDPDWSQRLMDAWKGKLVNSRREEAGAIVLDGGLLAASNSDWPCDGPAIPVVPGAYHVVLTVAYEGAEQTFDYAEHVSHAFLTLAGDHDVAIIEPCLDENGTELEVNAYGIAFAVAGVLPRINGDHAGLWSLRLIESARAARDSGEGAERYSFMIPNDDGSVAAICWHGGYGRADYPLFRLVDSDGRTVGVAADFHVDNRPWD